MVRGLLPGSPGKYSLTPTPTVPPQGRSQVEERPLSPSPYGNWQEEGASYSPGSQATFLPCPQPQDELSPFLGQGQPRSVVLAVLTQGPAPSRCLISPNSSAEGEAGPTLVQPSVNLTGRK